MIIPEINYQVAYVAIDPGETSGIVLYDENGKLLWFGQVKLQELIPELKTIAENNWTILTRIIVEEYRVYPHKAQNHVWSQLKTVRAIGMIEAIFWPKKITMQGASIKATGYKYLGIKKPPTKFIHQWDANAHGTYWLVNAGVLDASSLLQSDRP